MVVADTPHAKKGNGPGPNAPSPSRRLQIGGNRVEDQAEIGADEPESSDCGNRDERSDQAVLNGCRSVFIVNDLGQDGHLIFLLTLR